MKLRSFLLLAGLGGLAAWSGVLAEVREFKDTKGRSLKAEFLNLQGKKANLRLEDGKVVAVPLEKLSEADQEYIKNHPSSKFPPVELPERPLYAVKDWNEKLNTQEPYFIDQNGKRSTTIRRRLKKIHGNGFADGGGKYAVVEGPYLGILDTKGVATFGITTRGPATITGGSDQPIFMVQKGAGSALSYTYVNQRGRAIIRQSFRGARPFNSGRAWVNIELEDLPKGRHNGLWTLIDTQGRLLHAYEDLKVSDFSEERAAVAIDQRGRQWAIVDIDNKTIAEGPFGFVGPFINGAAVVDGGLMGKDGQWIIDQSSDSEWYFDRRHAKSEGDAIIAKRRKRVTDKSRYVILRRSTGEFIADIPDDLYVEDGFFDGLAAVRNLKTRKSGYMDRTGKLIVEPKFEQAERFRNGFAEVSADTLYDKAVINTGGTIIWRPTKRKVEEDPAEKEKEKKEEDPF